MTAKKLEKSAFQKFIEANEAMLSCYEKIDQKAFIAQEEYSTPKQCVQEMETLKSIISGDGLIMSNLLRERIDILRQMDAEYKKPEKKTDELFTYKR